ncbi:MAG: hypothetical protein HPY60_09010 [Candidatus Methanofastidiosum sp.]|nr:hypothetical protein [Methanofastidiosum sp.]
MKKKFSILITLLVFGSIFGVTSIFGEDLDLEIKDFNIYGFDTEYGHIYDAESKDGSLTDTYYDYAFILYVDGDEYDDASDNYTTEADGREYALDTEIMSDLIVYRKVYFPEDRNWIRYLEILHNPTSSPITVYVEIDTTLGSGSDTRCVKTSSGDTLADVNDYWVVSDDEYGGNTKSRPSLSHVWDGPGGADRIDYLSGLNDENGDMYYRWDDVTINPGQTVVLMHFGGFEMNNNNAIALAEDLYNYKDDKMKYDLQEINQIINWSPSRLAKAGNKPSLPIAQILKILKGNQEN